MFHLWPQGRIVRIAVLVVAVALFADLGYGGYAAIEAARSADTASGFRTQLILGIIYGLLAFTALIGGFMSAGPHRKAVGFLIEVQDEMAKVEWPKPGALWRQTLVVALVIAVIAGVVLLTDLALYGGLEFIQNIQKR